MTLWTFSFLIDLVNTLVFLNFATTIQKTVTAMKRFILLLALLLAASTAMAYDFEVGGIYYSKGRPNEVDVTYKDDTYNSYSGSVTIPSTVTYQGTTYTVVGIDWCTFYRCTGLTGVTLPNTIQRIGSSAFSRCTALTGITIPNSVTEINYCAFSNCTA